MQWQEVVRHKAEDEQHSEYSFQKILLTPFIQSCYTEVIIALLAASTEISVQENYNKHKFPVSVCVFIQTHGHII